MALITNTGFAADAVLELTRKRIAFANGVPSAAEWPTPRTSPVRHEKGRCFGWPANGGNCSWGNEIVVQYRSGEFQDKPVGSHDMASYAPITVATGCALWTAA